MDKDKNETPIFEPLITLASTLSITYKTMNSRIKIRTNENDWCYSEKLTSIFMFNIAVCDFVCADSSNDKKK